jgi:SAM-dependent methyltransferase
MLDNLQYHLLNLIASDVPESLNSTLSDPRKLEAIWGTAVLQGLRGQTIIDFGCGYGHEAVEIAHYGASKVIGLDLRPAVLEIAARNAAAMGLGSICYFDRFTEEKADCVFSTDTFEHFEDPAAILEIMSKLLKSGGRAFISFGPTWYHPLGGHLFSVFPWAHLLFSEKALIRWRARFRRDKATRFSEVDGGLNQMTLERFRDLVQQSSFEFSDFQAIPIARLSRVHGRLTEEFTTSMVRCVLVKKA